MIVSNSNNKLTISSSTSNPLLEKRREVVKGLANTPRRLLRTDSNKASAKLPAHYLIKKNNNLLDQLN